MKILVELDLDNPTHRQLLDQVLRANNPENTATQPVAPAITPPPAAPVAPPTAAVAPPPAAPPAAPAPTAPPAAPAPTQADLPTPLTDLRDQLNRAFGVAYSKDQASAMQLTEQCRNEYGMDNNNWTEEQWKMALSRMEALVTF